MAPPFLELSTIGSHDHDQDQYDHHHHDLFNYLEPQSSFSSTTSSLSSPIFLSPAQVQGPISDHYYREQQNFQFQLLEADHIVSYGGSCDHDQTLGNEGEKGTLISKHGADDHRNHESRSTRAENISVKWMSSKMRIMRKMTNPDQTISSNTTVATNDSTARVNFSSSHNFEEQKLHPSSPLGTDSSNNTNPIRVCSDCNTTKTPLWRSGPRGPKSLCNACGIRQRKARRAMAAAAAAANGTTLVVEAAPSMIKTNKVKLKDNKTIPFKKRCHKLTTSPSPRGKSKTKLRYKDFSISSMNQNSGAAPPTTATTTTTTTFQRVFPQDEKEAAILLMALSCGLVQG
ncbi:putative transcription factor C2C2-GATA family [Rosa chinensis]|uniref:Putative transcription factor C2C2-GATA family n=1 Tax=Rosa chinensis TaxID=74649 RepID=A0A2P6RK76_ROSCH|nr:GATA transcription factor 21 [Rosa chinensis]PRQ46834.1 putative transcription factor C2C2-GATA family [Rosa chinensis]